jgi:Phosphate-starvation-inducible E family
MVVRRPKLIALLARAERQKLSERATQGERHDGPEKSRQDPRPADAIVRRSDRPISDRRLPYSRAIRDRGAPPSGTAATFYAMVQKGAATIEDLLLLFIYLEIGSMVGIYFRTNHTPVRFLLDVGITALTRRLIGFVQHEESRTSECSFSLAPFSSSLSRSSSSDLHRTAFPPRPTERSPAPATAGPQDEVGACVVENVWIVSPAFKRFRPFRAPARGWRTRSSSV